jgi:hypothetical protein
MAVALHAVAAMFVAAPLYGKACPPAQASPSPADRSSSANGLYTRDPLQRHLCDALALSQHFSFNFDIAGAAFGLYALGGKYTNPTM